MAINFGRQANISRAETPRFAAAVAAEGKLEAAAKARANALRSQNMVGAGTMYNAGMGDRTPIGDYFFGEEAAADAVANTGNIAGTPLAVTEGAGAAGNIAGTPLAVNAAADGLATEAANGALVDGGAEAAISGAGGSSALAASMPYVAAALLAKNILF